LDRAGHRQPGSGRSTVIYLPLAASGHCESPWGFRHHRSARNPHVASDHDSRLRVQGFPLTKKLETLLTTPPYRPAVDDNDLVLPLVYQL